LNCKILVVDDNDTILKMVKAMLDFVGHASLSAASGEACLELLRGGFRGVILLDYVMPGLNGFETIKAMVDEDLIEGNVVCMLTGKQEPPAGLETMSEYIMDYVRKPFTMTELVSIVEAAMSYLEPEVEYEVACENIIVLGISTGGPSTLKELFTGMPRLNASILLVQHMPAFINERVRASLNELTELDVVIPRNGTELENGVVYVGPSGVHMELKKNRFIHLRQGSKINFVCPSVDTTMLSVAENSAQKLIAVVMTGMGKDGAEGIAHIKNIGGITIAQDEASSIVYGMPKQAVATNCVDIIAPPKEIQKRLIRLVGRDRSQQG
jgi:two-component system chemotaxis response regulator CheB